MDPLIVIPARLQSRRLPGKLLLAETGKPLLQHTYEQAKQTGWPIVVATPDDEVKRCVRSFGGNYADTSHRCVNGTERMAELAAFIGQSSEVFVNWQADWPEIDPDEVAEMVEQLESHEAWDLATLACPLLPSERDDPTFVKVRIVGNTAWDFARTAVDDWLHLGVYAYRREPLFRYASYRVTSGERDEDLEQLRAMELDMVIGVATCGRTFPGIDNRETYARFVGRHRG